MDIDDLDDVDIGLSDEDDLHREENEELDNRSRRLARTAKREGGFINPSKQRHSKIAAIKQANRQRRRESMYENEKPSFLTYLTESSNLRLIQTIKRDDIVHAKIYRDSEYDEYIVKFYDADGKYLSEADYHTDDKQDAVDTANAWVLNSY